MINQPNPQSAAQQPRALVYANGDLVAQVLSFQVDNNSFFQADTFRLTLALASQPVDRGLDWWALQEKLEMEFLIGFPADPDNFTKQELTSFLVGYVDDIEFDEIDDVLILSGRDLTSKLIDYKRSISFVGELTASGVVTQIAIERGLTPIVTPTQKPVGSYYQIFHKLIASDSTYWDIVTKLAQIERYQVYVKGSELHFEPRTAPDSDPYVIRRQKPTDDRGYPIINATKLKFTRNLSIAKDLKVRIISFDQKTKQKVEETAQRTRVYNKTTSKATKFSEVQEYVYNLPNLTPDQAKRRAQAILEELSRHEMNMHAEMPGDILLTAQNLIKVEGTGTVLDQPYYASTITRMYDFSDHGFKMHVEGKNQTPNNPS
ncbi:MAG: hypothetical protein A3I66_01460 [Burkholderiales bacterium RIFCSPLOWO2_02_FULL_57_36]|nr:MAG: hypothetical protein A3I66_01460 [Burkholderiales bacterium RIFCSPLOWO2_02_FULL_57_36]